MKGSWWSWSYQHLSVRWSPKKAESKESSAQGVQGQGCVICLLDKAFNTLKPLYIYLKKNPPVFLLLRFPVKAFSFCRAATLKNETTRFLLFLGLFFKNSQVALGRSRNSRPNVESSEFLRPCSGRLWDLQKVGQVPWHFTGWLQKPPGVWICINVFVLWLEALEGFWNGGNGRFEMHFCTQCVWEGLGGTGEILQLQVKNSR